MSVQEIQAAIIQLPPNELAALVEWIDDRLAGDWDKQIAEDAKAGRFEALRRRVQEQRQTGMCRPL
jgi:hypothetical protein